MPYIDLGKGDEEKIKEKGLSCPPLSGVNHLAIFIKWAYYKDMLSDQLLEKEPRLKGAVEGKEDLRKVILESPFFDGCITTAHFKEEYQAFVRYYYNCLYDDRYPQLVDDYAMNYFGKKRYKSAEFKDEAYLFVPYDDNYFNYMKEALDKALDNFDPQCEDPYHMFEDINEIDRLILGLPNEESDEPDVDSSADAKEYPEWPKNAIDNIERHEKLLKDNGKSCPTLAPYNLMAVFIKWAYGKDMVSESVLNDEPRLKEVFNENGDLREILAESKCFDGCITYDHFKDEIKPFIKYYYSFGWSERYPWWVNRYAIEYLGEEKCKSEGIKDMAYLLVSFDEDYYNYVAERLDQAWDRRTPMLKGETVGKEILDDLVKAIWDKTATEVIRMKINTGKTSLTSSKIAGYPYWPKNKEFISFDEEGSCPPVLLAQINLSDFKHEKFPDHGLLQLFISPDDDLGLDNKYYKVVYHEEIDESVTEKDIKSRGILAGSDVYDEWVMFPTSESYPISFEVTKESMNFFGTEAYDTVNDVLVKKYNVDLQGEDFWFYLSEEDQDYMTKQLPRRNSHLLGHAYFTQEDPRSYDEELRRYDTLLFQLETSFEEDIDIEIGDGGIINFFINHEDLKNRNFTDVLYNWDCM